MKRCRILNFVLQVEYLLADIIENISIICRRRGIVRIPGVRGIFGR